MRQSTLFVAGLLAIGATATPWGRPEYTAEVEARGEWNGAPAWYGEEGANDGERWGGPGRGRPDKGAPSSTCTEEQAAASPSAAVKNVTPSVSAPAYHTATGAHHSHSHGHNHTHKHGHKHNGTHTGMHGHHSGHHSGHHTVPAHNATAEAPAFTSKAPASTSNYIIPVTTPIGNVVSGIAPKVTPTPVTSQAPKNQQYSSSTSSSSSKPAEVQKPSSTTAGTSSTGTSTGTGSDAKASTYQQAVVLHHNLHRANHSAPEIAWDAGLASTAAKIAASCKFAHNTAMDGGGYGQNIAAGTKPEQISDVITGMFYNGEVNHFSGYGMDNPPDFGSWGHFSQVVWKSTTKVGCATQDCTAAKGKIAGADVDSYFTVCNYNPAGNFGGQYGKNVGKSLNKKTITWTEGLADSMLKAAGAKSGSGSGSGIGY